MPNSSSRTPPRTGRRELRKQSTRAELLRAGRRLFGEQGLYEPRIEELAHQAGIAKGTLYGYFADKEALVEAVVRDAVEQLTAHVEARTADSRPGPRRVENAVAAQLEFFAANPDLMRILHQARGLMKFGRPGTHALRRILRGYVERLAVVISGAPATSASKARALLIFGAVSGITSVSATLVGKLPDPRRIPTVARAITRLATDPTTLED